VLFDVIGSHDGNKWVDLIERKEPFFSAAFSTATLEFAKPTKNGDDSDKYYQYFKLTQKDVYFMPQTSTQKGAPFFCLFGMARESSQL